MGHSFGGLLMTAYAKDYPKQINCLLYVHCAFDLNTTLHLHVRVNEGMHPLEEKRRYQLDDIIKTLESGKTIHDLIIERGPVFLESSDTITKKFLEGIPGIAITEISNPFIISDQYIQPSHGVDVNDSMAEARRL